MTSRHHATAMTSSKLINFCRDDSSTDKATEANTCNNQVVLAQRYASTGS